jgi:hypothetical protein
MTREITRSIAALLVGLGLAIGCAGLAEARTVAPLESWSGRVPLDERPPLQTSIAKSSDWAHIWKQCRLAGPAPKADFQKTLGLVAVRRASVVKFADLSLDGGNLKTNVVVTPDMPEYMSCAVVLINRAGVKKINGNPVGQ